MRVLTVVVFAISVLDVGCGRAQTASPNTLTTPAPDAGRTAPGAERAEPAGAREGERAAVATAGKDSASAREVTIPAGTLLPLGDSVSNRSATCARPFTRPDCVASVTTPVTREPAGSTV